MFNGDGDHDKWSLEEKIRLLELFVDKDSGLWEDRANTLKEEFGKKRSTDFFTQTSVKRELSNIFNKPNPEHHIFGIPMHPRGKEAAELWLKHFRRELEEGRERQKQMFLVAMRKQLDLIRRYQKGKLPKEELDALLEEARERDAQRPDKEQYEERIKQHMAKAYFEDVKNVRTFADYFRFLRGVRIPTPARSPTPVKIFDEEYPKIIADSTQAITSLCISLENAKESNGESEARINLRPLVEFECVELQTRVAKYAETNEKYVLTKSGPGEFKEGTFPIRHVKCIENGSPIIAKGRDKTIDAKDIDSRTTVVGQAEPSNTSMKQQQQRTPRMQVAATPPMEKPKTRKRKHELSDETDVELCKPSEKRLRRSSNTTTGGSDAIFTFEAITSLCISLENAKESNGESEARINLRPLVEFECVELQTRVAKYAETNEKYVLTKSGPGEFKEGTFPIRHVKCIENGSPIIAKGRDKTIDAKDIDSRTTVVGQAEPSNTSMKQQQQRTPRMQVAATPPMEKPKTRKRKHELSDETDVELCKPSEKRLRRSSNTTTGGSDAIFTFEAITSLCISLENAKKSNGESEARINLRPLVEFECVELQTRVAKYAETNEKYVLTKSGPGEFKEGTFPIRHVKCIENGSPIIAKGRDKTIDAKDIDSRTTVVGQAEPSNTSMKQQQQRTPRMQVAATPPMEKPKARKRNAEMSGDESKETDAELDKPSEKRTRRSIKKEPADDKSLSSSTLSSPMSFVATPSQPIISEVAATAKLRSQLRRAAIASSTPSPAVDSVADNRLFLKPGKLSSAEVLPKQILLTLCRDILSHRYAPVFSFPVSEELVRGYHTAIKKPMDLKTLKTNIESGEVNTLGKFSHAILKMFANAVMYNSTGHYVNNYAKEMAAYALKCIEVVQFPAGQFHVPPPSRQSNGSSTEGCAVGGGGTAKFSIAWATSLIKPKVMNQKNTKNRNDEEKASTSSSQDVKEMEANHSGEGEIRRLFQRRRSYNKKYTFSSTI